MGIHTYTRNNEVFNNIWYGKGENRETFFAYFML